MINRLMAAPGKAGVFFVNVTTGGYGLSPRPSDFEPMPEYLVGLLNSRLLDFCLRNLSNHFHGGYFPANKQYVRRLPIKLPGDAAERKLADEVARRARRVVESKGALRRAAVGDRERRDLEASAEADERAIDELVLRLYGVDAGDVPRSPGGPSS